MIEAELMIDGKPVKLGAQHALRFSGPGENLEPALYIDGKRVVKRWTLVLKIDEEADASGCNANCAG